jgi:hypothetical protein
MCFKNIFSKIFQKTKCALKTFFQKYFKKKKMCFKTFSKNIPKTPTKN